MDRLPLAGPGDRGKAQGLRRNTCRGDSLVNMPRDRTLDDNTEARTAAVTESEDLASAQSGIQRITPIRRTQLIVGSL